MGREKARKPKRQRPPRGPSADLVSYDEFRAFDSPVTIPAGDHTLGVQVAPDGSGVMGRLYLEDGTTVDLMDRTSIELAADPLTDVEVAEMIDRWPGLGVTPPSAERANYVCARLSEKGLIREAPWGGAYRVTQAGHAYLRRMMRSTTVAELPVPVVTTEEGPPPATDDDAALLLTGYLFAERLHGGDPERAAALHEKYGLDPTEALLRMLSILEDVEENR